MKVGIIGAGPAGLTAAYLLKLSGHHPLVFEAEDRVGGRTKTVHFAPGHHFDAGAGWISSAYKETLGLVRAFGAADELRSLDLWSVTYLSQNGTLHQLSRRFGGPFSYASLSFKERTKLALWEAGLWMRHPFQGDAAELRFDRAGAESYVVKCVGKQGLFAVFEPMASTLCLSVSELSAAAMRSIARDLLSQKLYTLASGMDSLWKKVAIQLDVEVGKAVRHVVQRSSSKVELVFDEARSVVFDACVVAAPITRMRHILEGVNIPSFVWNVRYSPCVRVYGARRGATKDAHIYPADLAEEAVTVSRGGNGWLWGTFPRDHSAAVVTAGGTVAADLMDEPDDKLEKLLWEKASILDPDLFGIDRCYAVRVVRWEEAAPVFSPGHLRNLASWKQSLPVVFAGDWMSCPNIEGAVRSGIKAARLFGKA